MQNLDPNEKQQKALPVSVYRELHRVARSSGLILDITVAWLQTVGYFWCMRSCEYSDVQGEQRTKLLCVRNVRFFDENNQDISKNYSYIQFASTVSVTFEFQKKDVRNNTISHQHSGDSIVMGEMCPVKSMAAMIKQIRSYDIPEEK